MYSQYQQYQQGGGMAVATQQQAMTWNGTSWVHTNSQVGGSTQSTYSSNMSTQSSASTSTENPVSMYTRYYHGWKAKESEEEKKAQTLQGKWKEEAQRQAAWAKYYADQASRAAHYYNNPQGPAPEFPPAPPNTSTQVSLVKKQPESYTQKESKSNTQEDSKGGSPGGLKRYVHRCLTRCKGKKELQLMQEKVQNFITEALKDGTMHTINWDEKQLIPMQGEVTADKVTTNIYTTEKKQDFSSQSNGNKRLSVKHQNSLSNNGNYYGNSEVSSTSSSYYNRAVTDDKYSRKLPTNNSYYGRQESKSTSPNSFTNPQKTANKVRKDKEWTVKAKDKNSEKKRKFSSGFEKSKIALKKRANRFGNGKNKSASINAVENVDKYMGIGFIGGASKIGENDYEKMIVKGTCQTLEKEYLRLTAPPRAELVRPQPILERHLCKLMEERGNEKHREYVWFCSQFKALRQDLTVQRIFNDFAIRVYESHARVALEERDLNEYNQCQTQLKELYSSLSNNQKAVVNQNEFISYRLIYYVLLTSNKKYEGGSSDLFDIMLSLTPEQKQNKIVAHALKVRSAVADFNYHVFFRLQNDCPTPEMVYLMDYLVPIVRLFALHRICKAIRPNVSVDFVLCELGFEKDEFEHGAQWLESCGCVLSKDRESVQTKDCVVHESDWKEQNSLI
eukprot:CAMPEP_0194200732 /NCGR_PEP_ID=MMETSP0156-20130528/1210_1 /TAXON_ID=33649 /ORGANISM="Thalassionema nitzschioides, Strain L26-B" /LENGTH=674 /DNA_ID=CAMNT_0038925769 /DNA_START=92 /DNA_END=2116 /DNA_ORIENTATION=-